MKKIQLLNKIAKCGTNIFGSVYNVGESVENPDAIMVRSAAMHDMEFGANLKAIARAGAGVNNIPLDKCAEAGIVVFNTPGATANGVKELVLCGMLLACRDVVGGIEWVKENAADETIAKRVEKEKSKFAGTEVAGKTLGIIGLGAIGGPLANAAVALGMDVLGCDPYMSVDAAWKLSRSVHKADNGFVIETLSYGYADNIRMYVGICNEGKVTGLVVREAHETVGLGSNALTDHEFLSQFLNSAGSFEIATNGADAFSSATGTADAGTGETVEVDGITGATVTSKAVARSVNSAVAYVTGADVASSATTWGG